jgi:hypothetical protein
LLRQAAAQLTGGKGLVFLGRIRRVQSWHDSQCQQSGFAVQALANLIHDTLAKIRFPDSQLGTCVEASERIARRSDSKKVAGVESIGLSEEAGKKIQTWIS